MWLMLWAACVPASDANEDLALDVQILEEQARVERGVDAQLLPGRAWVTRDERGIPHIEGADLATALYGLGWVQAEDRLFQMFERRAKIRGRLAEFFAVDASALPSDEQAEAHAFNRELITSDRAMRTLSMGISLDRIVSEMPEGYVDLLSAFARGVNDQIAARPSLGTAFVEAGIRHVDPWTTADALTGWDAIGSVFGNPLSAANLEIRRLAECECSENGCPGPARCSDYVVNEDAAVVPPPADGMWPPGAPDERGARMASYTPIGELRPPVDVKASQGFVVAGRHLTTGRPLIFGEPQLALVAPSNWYEHHIVVPSEDIDVRGVGFAGSPGVALYFSRYGSQTITAGGGDEADLFELQQGSEGTYLVDGEELTYRVIEQEIKVRGGRSIPLAVRYTRWGPVVTDVLNLSPVIAGCAHPGSHLAGREFAMRRVGDYRRGDHSVIAGIELMRARNLEDYRNALRHWTVPTVNALYAGVDAETGEGHIAFHSLLTIPRRAGHLIGRLDVEGRYPYDGSQSRNDWSGVRDLNWNPHVIDPENGYIFSGNHLAVGSWYDSFVYAGLRGNGDTVRSYEMRRRLGDMLGGDPVDPADLHALHVDAESQTARIFLRALQTIRDRGLIPAYDPEGLPADLNESASRALAALQRWHTEGGGLFDQRSVGANFANAALSLFVPPSRRDSFACTWGGAEGGITHFLSEFVRDPSVMGDAEVEAVIWAAGTAWDRTVDADDQDVSRWTPTEPIEYRVRYQNDFNCLAPGCSLNSDFDVLVPIHHRYINTITSSTASSWPFTVEFSDVDRSYALLAPGVSEEPRSPRYDDQVPNIVLKGQGDIDGIPSAPLDLALIESFSTELLVDEAR